LKLKYVLEALISKIYFIFFLKLADVAES